MQTYLQFNKKISTLANVAIASNKIFFFQLKSTRVFLTSARKICCGYSLEVPHRGTSNEYPQHMFSCRNKKILMWISRLSGAMCSRDLI